MNVRKLKNFIIDKIKKELPKNLTYHGVHHTLEVYETCNRYIKRLGIDPEDAYLLRTAALLHDIGIMWEYSNHEEVGMQFVRDELPKWGYTKEQIDRVCGMMRATRIPQDPQNLLEEVLCDADVDYLGTDKFYEIGETLYQEFLSKGIVSDEKSWDMLQINFLEKHHYHTDFAKKHREPVKRRHLQDLKDKWNIQ